MNYIVCRGLREIVAPSHRIAKSDWAEILKEFEHVCAYCGQIATAENRGIVPDHLVAVTQYGELVLGNTVPACQACNDARGNKDWRAFLTARNSPDRAYRIARIDEHVRKHAYLPSNPKLSLTPGELTEYTQLLRQWEDFLGKAQHLRNKVAKRRSAGG